MALLSHRIPPSSVCIKGQGTPTETGSVSHGNFSHGNFRLQVCHVEIFTPELDDASLEGPRAKEGNAHPSKPSHCKNPRQML